MLALYVSLVLLWPAVVIAAEAAETEALNHFGGEKFTAQWHPLCRWRSHFPREFHAFRLYCIDFHAWNSLILKDNIMDAIWCKEWPHFQREVAGGLQWDYVPEDKPSKLTLSFSLCATLTCFQLYYRTARWSRRGFHKVTWPSLFLRCGGHLTMGSCFRRQQEDGWSRGLWDG